MDANDEGTDAIRDAAPPFSAAHDDLNPPDVILRSCDLVDFHAHKHILSFSSPFFREMFAFPEPPQGSAEANPTKHGVPVVQMLEQSGTLEKLLKLCYSPYATAFVLENLDDVVSAYKACKMYDVLGAPALLESAIMTPTFLKQNPFRVYAIGCLLGNANIVKAAAMATLGLRDVSFRVSFPELELLSAKKLWILQELKATYIDNVEQHLRSISTAVDQLDSDCYLSDAEFDRTWWLTHPDCPLRHPPDDDDDWYPPTYVFPSPWFFEHISRITEYRAARDEPVEWLVDGIKEIPTTTLGLIASCPKCLARVQDDLRCESQNMEYFLGAERRQLVEQFMSTF